PDLTIRRDLVAFAHLRLRLQVGANAVQHVEHHQAGVAHHQLGTGDSIQVRQVRLGDEAQHIATLRSAWGTKRSTLLPCARASLGEDRRLPASMAPAPSKRSRRCIKLTPVSPTWQSWRHE